MAKDRPLFREPAGQPSASHKPVSHLTLSTRSHRHKEPGSFAMPHGARLPVLSWASPVITGRRSRVMSDRLVNEESRWNVASRSEECVHSWRAKFGCCSSRKIVLMFGSLGGIDSKKPRVFVNFLSRSLIFNLSASVCHS